ncbi:hypothetical protein AZ78_1764 [Lysobacter capsici AZ78]|uniref:Uncharacterized protein n=1 Tax=Lysobacter capsici AZ78 TaxID=1444315 RepID=A0A108U7X1_9GAMM|nr:hypothetical protein AZ78_1764 [Lysobacter capsici AZ78]
MADGFGQCGTSWRVTDAATKPAGVKRSPRHYLLWRCQSPV